MPFVSNLLFQYPAQMALAWARDQQAIRGYFSEAEFLLQRGVGHATLTALKEGGYLAELQHIAGRLCVLTRDGLLLIQM